MLRIIISLVMIISGATHAVLPSDIYRRDTRGPDVIFNEGFSPRGSNTNLLQHVSGESLRGDNGVPLSLWVSASSSLRWTTTPRYPINEFWVYTITPDSRAYSVEISFNNYINTTENQSGISYVRRLLEIYGEQHEWSVLGGISANMVRFGTRYVFASGEFIAVETRSNPNYRSSIPSPNPEPYPIAVNNDFRANAIDGRLPSTAARRWTGLSLSACWGVDSLQKEKRDTSGLTVVLNCSVPHEANITRGTPFRNASIMSVTTIPWFFHDEY
ncbi:hypothetical protein GKA92_23655 [Salmonella enterica subsp. enterica]|nr:hypothetical protein [Salmonella enterica subsp. enterica serovar Abaetetuba]